MGARIFDELASIAALTVGLAVIAVVVSKKSDTGNVLKNAGDSLSSIIKAAVAPVS